MKIILLNGLLLGLFSTTLNAQITEKQLKTFAGNQTIVSSSGPGLTMSSGDILLELSDKDDPDVETVMLVRNSKGKLRKIDENSSLLMGHQMLGISGGNYPSLDDKILSLDYTIGSSSSQSDVSIIFEKNVDGYYYFKEYTLKTHNYGVENLFARQRIESHQTGKIAFRNASENLILAKAELPAISYSNDVENKVASKFLKYIPEGWGLAALAEGDLNLDQNKNDVLLIVYNEDRCSVRLLMHQQDGRYKLATANERILATDENFNAKNLRAVIKNGFYTIEQRIAVNENDFEHRYLTFRYVDAQKSWVLHRYDIEYFSGFNPKPLPNVIHLTKNDFGTILFKNMQGLPVKKL